MSWQSLVIEAKSLACERGGRLVFKNLSFTANSADVIELRGPNGSGKSSLLRMIAGLNKPVAGKLVFINHQPVIPAKAGISVSVKNTDSRFRGNDDALYENAHYIGHSDSVKSALTVKENLAFWTAFQGGSANLAPFKLQHLADDEARLLSEGQRRRLALSRLVSVMRPIWLLDEPSVGLDQPAMADLQREMKTHIKSGGIIIAATHVGLGIKNARNLQLSEAA